MTTQPEKEQPEATPAAPTPEAAPPPVPPQQPPQLPPQPPPQPPPAPPPAPYVPPPPPSPMHKAPLLAGFLSFMPGLGNVYNGLYQRGILFFLLFISLVSLADAAQGAAEPFFIGSTFFFWFFNVFDAYRQAQLINYHHGSDVPPEVSPDELPSRFSGSLGLGIALLVIGLLGVLELYTDLRLEEILEHWPLALVGLGIWMIVRAIRARSEETAAAGLDDFGRSDDLDASA